MATNNVINQIGPVPLFSAYCAADQSNVTGDGTVYTLTFPNILQNITSSFNGTSIFTAPLNGMYQFNVGLYFNGFTGNNATVTAALKLVTTSKTYLLYFWGQNAGQYLPPVALNQTVSQICQLTAGDTAYVTLESNNDATKSISIIGKTNLTSYTPIFSGYMITGI